MTRPPAPGAALREFGVYVHVPFCAARCDYCDFATWTDRGHLVARYVDACVLDLERRSPMPATSVFFGGGTPSLLDAALLVRILDAIPRTAEAEVTVECNPDSVDPAKLAAYAAAGVNRVSIGVQSMVPHVLSALGRTHDPANVERAVGWARAAGIARVNLDVIYGTPGETAADWDATLAAVLALAPEHVSAYALTVEPGTPLGRATAAGTRPAPDDDVLRAAGLEWYEVSNWARPGEACRHNLLYWHGGDYLAIGCAAHGHTGGRRWWNVRTPERYIDAVEHGRSPEAGAERLDPDESADETLVLALRTASGVKLSERSADPDAVDACVDDLQAAGLLVRQGGRAVLTRSGRLLANEVATRLLLAREAGRSRRRADGRVGTRYD